MRPRLLSAVAAVLLVTTAGTVYTLGAVGTPTVSGVDNWVEGLDDDETHIRTDVTIDNPNPFGIEMDDLVIEYAVSVANVTMATGREQGISIGPGRQTLSFQTAMSNDRISEWWVRHVRNGERSTLLVTVDVRSPVVDRSVSATPVERPVETNILPSLNSTDTREVDADLLLVDDPVLYVNETAAWWGQVTASESPMVTRLTVYNPKPIPYTITAIGYDVTMNDVRVGEGEIDRSYVLEPQSTTTVDATTVIDNDRLDEWWITHLENGERTTLRVHYYAVIELPTGQVLRIPLEDATNSATFETAIFDDDRSVT